jgi:hypothetical protein
MPRSMTRLGGSLGFNTREEWLEAAVGQLVGILPEKFQELPPLKVSVGFPGGRTTIGIHFDKHHSFDKETHHIFIHPKLDGKVDALSTLLHEVIHAAAKQHGHGKKFARIAAAVGFLPPWTKTPESEGLRAHLEELGEKLGPYPHIGMDLLKKKKQPTRMKLYECPEGRKIRSAKPVRARCLDCDGLFKKMEGGGGE